VSAPARITTPEWWASVSVVWAVAVAGAWLVMAMMPEASRTRGFALALGAAVLAAMIAQLATRQRRGLVVRLILSVAGSVVVVAAAVIADAVVNAAR
jgi:hypothetical protein